MGAWRPGSNPIATNTAYDHLRRCRRISFMPLPEVEIARDDVCTFETQLEDGEPVSVALAQLPLDYRVPLMLRVYQEQSIQEIANMLGCSSSAVKMRLFPARKRFREVYQEPSPC